MKPEVKEFLTSINELNVILKRNALMLEELNSDWQNIFKEVNKSKLKLTKLNQAQRTDLLKKTDTILSTYPTYFNNNAVVLYESFKKDTANYLSKTSLTSDTTFEQLYLKQQVLEFEYSNYQKQKQAFSETLKSIQVFRNILNKNDEIQK